MPRTLKVANTKTKSHTRSAHSAPSAPSSLTTSPTSLTHHVHEVKQPGFFSNVFQGFGLGAGQSLAFNMFRSDPVVHHKHEGSDKDRAYVQCMKEKQDTEECKKYLE